MLGVESETLAAAGRKDVKNLQSRVLLGVNNPALVSEKNKMKPTNPNAHTYVNGTDVKTHGYAVTHNTFLQ